MYGFCRLGLRAAPSAGGGFVANGLETTTSMNPKKGARAARVASHVFEREGGQGECLQEHDRRDDRAGERGEQRVAGRLQQSPPPRVGRESACRRRVHGQAEDGDQRCAAELGHLRTSASTSTGTS